MAQQQNITIDQGATFSMDVTIFDDYGETMDLTGYSANSQIRKHFLSANVVNMTTTINTTAGIVNLYLAANSSAAMTPGRYNFDLDIISANGFVTRVIEGICTIRAGVTR